MLGGGGGGGVEERDLALLPPIHVKFENLFAKIS